MAKVSIELPPIEAEDTVEVELTVNGVKRRILYRVELFHWTDYVEEGDDRVTCLKRMIDRYEDGWRLVQIGVPTETNIPVMFERLEQAAAPVEAQV